MSQQHVAPVDSAAIAAALFAGEEQLFAASVPAIAPSPDDALIFWANKRPVVLPKGRQHANVSPEYSGFLVPTDQNPLVDEAFDRAGGQTITIQHSDGDREHWRIDTAALFVITQGVQSQAQMAKTGERFGLAYGWGLQRDSVTKEPVIDARTGKPKTQSILRFRCLLPELLAVGYVDPLRFSISGTMTGDVLQGLSRQFAVLRAIAAGRAAQGLTPLALPFWALSLTFEPGLPSKRGITTVIPPTVKLPQVIDNDYIRMHRVKAEWIPFIEDILEETVAWSIVESAHIGAGAADAAPLAVENGNGSHDHEEGDNLPVAPF